MNKGIFFCLMLAAALPALAQSVDVVATAAPLEQATISDVDFIRSTTPKWIFTLDLRMHPQGNQTQEVLLELRADVALAGGKSAEDIFYLKTKTFVLSPARTITTIPYFKVIETLGDGLDFRRKAVFVGISEDFRAEQVGGFQTVFSGVEGSDLSSVELAATVFSNLLEGSSIETIGISRPKYLAIAASSPPKTPRASALIGWT